jgi:hypothetical protein
LFGDLKRHFLRADYSNKCSYLSSERLINDGGIHYNGPACNVDELSREAGVAIFFSFLLKLNYIKFKSIAFINF